MNKPTTTRRDFLGRGAALAGAAALAPSWLAAPLRAWRQDGKPPPVLVNVYLRGGADWLNMVVPWRDPRYLDARPGLRIAEEDGLVPLDGDFGLHPGLAPLAPFYAAKSFAPLLCAGSPHPTRSHFDAQDFMEYAAPGNRSVTDGWLNRYLRFSARGGASEFRALAMQELLPRSMRGEFPALAVPTTMDRRKGRRTLDKFEEFYGGAMPAAGAGAGEGESEGEGEGEDGGEAAAEEGGMMEGASRRPADDKLVQSGRMTIETLRRYQEIVGGPLTEDNGGYPQSGFGSKLRAIAKVIKADAGLEVAGVDYPGWDHHVTQGGVEGRHHEMLADYARSLASFCQDLGERMEGVLVLTMTEFGRTVRENGNNGTDHGRGGGMFLLGGPVKGGRVYGEWRGLEETQLVEGRDLPVTTDFRDVMAAALDGLFGFAAPKDFFPDYKVKPLRLF